jgi:exodeoxyribonuclease VII large subunit
MPNLFDLPFEEESPRPDTERHAARSSAADPRVADSGQADATASAATPFDRRSPLSVSALTAAIRDRLESEFFEVWVEGELSNCRLWNGLAYFTLKDASAQMRAVMFRSAVRRLRFRLEDGGHVLARGRVSVYEPRGECQLIVEHVEPRGLGALQLAFEQLKKTLTVEGLFAEARKRPLPVLPRKIGIVTSLDGAALRDIVRVISDRHANVHLVVHPARVQGEGAAEDLARALRRIARVPGVDVVIIGRGGGSIEDLWAFNEELLARTIAACPVPVIAAVGHEVDWTIADFVADVRAATPSNAAELVIARADEFCGRIDRAVERLRAAVTRGLQGRRGRVHALTSRRGLASVPLRIASRARRVDELQQSMERLLRAGGGIRRRRLEALRRRVDAVDPVRRLGDLRTRWLLADRRLQAALPRRVERDRGGLATVAARLHSLSPLAVLGRGYALCWANGGRTLLREATPDLQGQEVSVTLARGSLVCDVRQAVPSAGESSGSSGPPRS